MNDHIVGTLFDSDFKDVNNNPCENSQNIVSIKQSNHASLQTETTAQQINELSNLFLFNIKLKAFNIKYY